MTAISDSYSRRTDLSYQQNPGSRYYPQQQPPYGQFQNIPNLNNNPISPYQTQNQPFPIDTIDRAGVGGALSGIHTGTVSVCIERVRPFENSCLDHLIMRQREARYGRSSNDVQRRICWFVWPSSKMFLILLILNFFIHSLALYFAIAIA